MATTLPPTTDPKATVHTWLGHIRALAQDIGPRGPTTQGERQAAGYCSDIFASLGLTPTWEAFSSAVSIFHPHLYASVAMLAAFILYPLYGSISAYLAAALTWVALLSQLLELAFINNPLRLLVPKGQSQNVFATLPPSGMHHQDLVLIGHLDSQRTPLIFKNSGWLAAYKRFTTIAFVAFILQALFFTIGAVQGSTSAWLGGIPAAICAVLLAALCLQAESTPFSHGANDNASSAGLLLTVAEHYQQQPLQHTRLWLVCTGCEEVQHYGAIDFFQRHRQELVKPKALVFEMLGCAGPAWLTQEGIVIPFHATPEMLNLAKGVAQAHPELDAYPVRINGGNTEMADALHAGLPAITLTGMTPDGEAPYWHQIEDTFDKMDPAAMQRNLEFTLAMIETLDRRGEGMK